MASQISLEDEMTLLTSPPLQTQDSCNAILRLYSAPLRTVNVQTYSPENLLNVMRQWKGPLMVVDSNSDRLSFH